MDTKDNNSKEIQSDSYSVPNGASIVEKAKEVAARAHEGQVRKTDGTPYIHHPLAVAALLKEHGFDDVTIAAGLVHDVLEDTDVTEGELLKVLGEKVVAIVSAVSEDKALPWKERKRQYVAQIVSASESVKAVSVADKIHNAESVVAFHATVGPKAWTYFNKGKEDKLWFEELLCSQLAEVWQHPLLEIYKARINDMQKLA